MAIVDLKKICLFTSIRKKLNRSLIVWPDKPNYGAGFHPELLPGVYRMYPTSFGKLCLWSDFYEPSVQTQPNKVITQQKFADAVLAWQNLTIEKQVRYNELAVGQHFSGYNLFIRNYMHG